MNGINRRKFLNYSALGCFCFLPGARLLSLDAGAAPATGEENYYVAHRKAIVGAFAGTLEGAKQYLAPEMGAERAGAIARQALANFEKLLPQLPDVGGDQNINTVFITIAAWYVALYGPLRANGKTAEDVGKLIYELNRQDVARQPEAQSRAEGAKLFSAESLAQLRDWAAATQKRKYPGDWVACFIPGDGKDFDFGYDYTECGVVKYLKAQGVPELAPYVCLNDFLKSKALGTGLRRSKTIAQRDGICNFRYKRNRPVLQDWSTEIALIRTRMAK